MRDERFHRRVLGCRVDEADFAQDSGGARFCRYSRLGIVGGHSSRRPQTLGGWLLLLVVALPLLVLSERVSERLFESPRVARLSAPARVAYGVVVIGVLLLAIAVALSSFSSSLGRW